MLTTFSYEIGAVFLLAALLMYGTRSGFILPSFQVGKLTSIILGVLMLVFGIYHLGPDLSAAWSSMFASATNSASPPQTPAIEAAPRPSKPAASHAKAADQLAPHWKTVVVDDAVPAPTEAAQSSANASSPASPASEQADTTRSEKPPSSESSDESPHDRRIKRAVKRVGRFLHITRGKN